MNLAPQVPPGASAALVNVTLVSSTRAGHVTVWPAGRPLPNTSTFNATGSGQTLANTVLVSVSASSQINLFTTGGGQLLVDVFGYFAPVRGNDQRPVPTTPTGSGARHPDRARRPEGARWPEGSRSPSVGRRACRPPGERGGVGAHGRQPVDPVVRDGVGGRSETGGLEPQHGRAG